MGRIDIKAKEYMHRPEVFADLFNHLMYDGEPTLKPENLSSMDPTEIGLPTDEIGNIEAVQKFRDVLKSAVMMEDENAAYLMVLGIENQMNIHYAMPVRNMIYDALNYGHQVTNAGKRNKKSGMTDSRAEYLSGFRKDDHLIPVVTLVVYFGQDEWDGPLSIHEMFPKCNERILKYVPEYRINLISPVTMSDDEISKFKSEFRQLATMICCGKDKKKWKSSIEENEKFRHIDPLTADLAYSVTNIGFKLKINEKGEVDVCQAVKEIREEEYKEGQIYTLSLIQKLIADGRMDDVKKAAADPAYFEKLAQEYDKR